MTKKDFQLIADVVNNFRLTSVVNNERVSGEQVANLSEMFANALEQINPRFDRSRFLDACYSNEQ